MPLQHLPNPIPFSPSSFRPKLLYKVKQQRRVPVDKSICTCTLSLAAMIRYRPTLITLGQDDLLFHLESLRMKYAVHPGSSGDRRPPREDDESSEDSDCSGTFFRLPVHSPFTLSHCSSSDGDGASEPELPVYLREGGGRNHRTADATGRHRADEPTGLEDHCNGGEDSIVSTHTVEQTDPQSSVPCGIDDSVWDSPVVRGNITTTQETPSQDSEVHSLTPTAWRTTLNTAFDRLKGHPPPPPTYLYQLSPAPSDFTLPPIFSVQRILCNTLCQQLSSTETPNSTHDTPDTATSLDQSTYQPPALPSTPNLRCFDQPMSKLPSLQAHSIVMPQWTAINQERGMNARSSLADSNSNTTMDLPLGTDGESHMHGHLDKIISDMSSSSGVQSADRAAGVNTVTNTHNTQCPGFAATARERQAMVSTEKNHRISNTHPGVVAPHGCRSGLSKASNDEFVTSTVTKAKYLQQQVNLLAQELQDELKEDANDYGLAALRSRPLGQWYHI